MDQPDSLLVKRNNHIRCVNRDREILKFINQVRVANTDQINLVNFATSSLRMCQRRLRILSKVNTKHKNPPLRRDRYSVSEPYYYYNASDKKPGQIEHILGVTWIVTWFIHTLKSTERFYSFDREIKDYALIRPDGLIGIKDLMTNTIKFTFLEFNVEESGNDFQKVSKYCLLESTEAYRKSWWVLMAKTFPEILIVTTGNPRKIRERIKRDNSEGLKFKVMTLDQLKEECLNGRSGICHL